MNATASKALFEAEVLVALDERVLSTRGWVVHSRVFPIVELSFTSADRGSLRIRVTCDDWNDMPPSVELLDPAGTLLAVLPAQRPVPGTATIFNGSAHPTAGRPFVCMIGVREYHNHPSHVTDGWANHKVHDGYSLGGIITQLWRGWQRTWP